MKSNIGSCTFANNAACPERWCRGVVKNINDPTALP